MKETEPREGTENDQREEGKRRRVSCDFERACDLEDRSGRDRRERGVGERVGDREGRINEMKVEEVFRQAGRNPRIIRQKDCRRSVEGVKTVNP